MTDMSRYELALLGSLGEGLRTGRWDPARVSATADRLASQAVAQGLREARRAGRVTPTMAAIWDREATNAFRAAAVEVVRLLLVADLSSEARESALVQAEGGLRGPRGHLTEYVEGRASRLANLARVALVVLG